jgi:hypothetical protein
MIIGETMRLHSSLRAERPTGSLFCPRYASPKRQRDDSAQALNDERTRAGLG